MIRNDNTDHASHSMDGEIDEIVENLIKQYGMDNDYDHYID